MKAKEIANEVLLPEVGRLIREGHTVTIAVRGNSMNPFLHDRRDRIILGAFTDVDLHAGVCALVKATDGRYLFHRIISRSGSRLTLRGDGNVKGTEQADTAEVIGIMLTAIRKEHSYPVEGRAWRTYSRLWMNTVSVRRWLLGVYRRLYHII
jgi:signal peptidase I